MVAMRSSMTQLTPRFYEQQLTPFEYQMTLMDIELENRTNVQQKPK